MADTLLITLSGEIDLAQVEVLRDAHAVFQRSAVSSAVVDLSDVTFFGSEGCGLLARLHRVTRQRGGTLTVVNPSPTAVQIIEICGLGDVIYERHFPAAWASVELPQGTEELPHKTAEPV